jgi:hypothetical protein
MIHRKYCIGIIAAALGLSVQAGSVAVDRGKSSSAYVPFAGADVPRVLFAPEPFGLNQLPLSKTITPNRDNVLEIKALPRPLIYEWPRLAALDGSRREVFLPAVTDRPLNESAHYKTESRPGRFAWIAETLHSQPYAVPEPSGYAVLAAGLSMIAFLVHKARAGRR